MSRRAQRQPRVLCHLRWLLWVFLLELVCAALVTAPLTLQAQTSGLLQGARGDSVLFDPGGVALVELVHRNRWDLWAASRMSLFVAAAVGLLNIYVLALTLVTLHVPTPLALSRRILRAIQVYPRLLLATLLGLVALWGGVSLLARVVAWQSGVFYVRLGERCSDLATLALYVMGAFLIALGALIVDLSRAALVARRSTLLQASRVAFATLRLFPASLVGRGAARLGLATMWVVACTILPLALQLPRGGTLGLALTWVFTQAGALGFLLFRFDWWCVALDRISAGFARYDLQLGVRSLR